MNGYKREYRSGQYYYQNMKAPMADYQNTASFMNGVSPDMLGAKVKDKKTHFIEPANKPEQEAWLDSLINDIQSLGKREFADLL